MLATILGRKARFCNGNCASGFRTDRQQGLIYTATFFGDGKYLNPEPASVCLMKCAYCASPVNGVIPPSHRAQAEGVGINVEATNKRMRQSMAQKETASDVLPL